MSDQIGGYVDGQFADVVLEASPEVLVPSTAVKPVRGLTRKDVSAIVAEFVGCFLFVFIGAGSIIANTWTQDSVGLMGIAAAHGLALGILITIFGATSGGHFNPAVTVALLVAHRIKALLALAYLLAQLLGATLGAFLLRVTFPVSIWKAAQLGTPGLSTGISPQAGVVVEALLTFFLLLAIYGTAIDTRAPKLGGFAIGLTVMVGILGAGVLTGGAMNPARAFGPALASGDWNNHIVYWIGPLVGAILAAFLYEYVILPRSQEIIKEQYEDGQAALDDDESVVPHDVREENIPQPHRVGPDEG
ncbi:aquaporin [Dictyobacter arantiisoli]|uniref:Aquaporin n=1 Tax=Dictyobacter arantiisoli TaxID=2014874 RepID=A0A5A5TIY3_9CHLR|nr:aquaporin [Dictyobacter arantiisoli]GCF11377.1 aquaporin [Dictyobacter arantiisoli]